MNIKNTNFKKLKLVFDTKFVYISFWWKLDFVLFLFVRYFFGNPQEFFYILKFLKHDRTPGLFPYSAVLEQQQPFIYLLNGVGKLENIKIVWKNSNSCSFSSSFHNLRDKLEYFYPPLIALTHLQQYLLQLCTKYCSEFCFIFINLFTYYRYYRY